MRKGVFAKRVSTGHSDGLVVEPGAELRDGGGRRIELLAVPVGARDGSEQQRSDAARRIVDRADGAVRHPVRLADRPGERRDDPFQREGRHRLTTAAAGGADAALDQIGVEGLSATLRGQRGDGSRGGFGQWLLGGGFEQLRADRAECGEQVVAVLSAQFVPQVDLVRGLADLALPVQPLLDLREREEGTGRRAGGGMREVRMAATPVGDGGTGHPGETGDLGSRDDRRGGGFVGGHVETVHTGGERGKGYVLTTLTVRGVEEDRLGTRCGHAHESL